MIKLFKVVDLNINRLVVGFFLLSFTIVFAFSPCKRIAKNAKIPKLQKTFEIKGIITDSEGVPLPGVTIYVSSDSNPRIDEDDGSNNFVIRGTQTDFNGEFTLKVSVNYYLNVSALGYQFYSQKILSEDKTYYAITLEEEVSSLEAIVLVGYGTQKRREVSSAISSIKAGKVQENLGAYPSFDRGLPGLIKGVQVIQKSGQIGASVDINIRGITSPFSGSDNNPLFVIDGVPFQANPLNFNTNDETRFNENPNPLQTINPNDIESIDVLKDASATAIYGSRGVNGVIIVKTKRGKRGQKTKINLFSVSTFGTPIRMLDYLNAAQYKERLDHLFKNSAAFANSSSALSINTVNTYNYLANLAIDGTGADRKITYSGLKEDFFQDADTNWSKEVYRPVAFTQRNNVSIRGGGTDTSYGVNVGHTTQEGLLKAENYKQYNFSTNVDSQINKAISVGGTVNVNYSDHQSGLNDVNNSLNTDILNARPDVAPYDEDGNFKRIKDKLNGYYDAMLANPIAKATGHDSNLKTFSVLGNLYTEVEWLNNLKVRGSVNIARFSNEKRLFNPHTIVQNIVPAFGARSSSLTDQMSVNTNVTFNVTADYHITLAEKHNLYALVGMSRDRLYSHRKRHFYTDFPDDKNLTTATYAKTTSRKSVTDNQSGLNSFFSRASYNYDEKYFITLNFRTDISSKFGPGNERAYFPSVSGSYNVAKESFFKEAFPYVNNLRLRLGYGHTGSQNVADFAYQQFFRVGFRAGGLYNSSPAVGSDGALPNLDTQWENTKEWNMGLDYGFLNNRIRGSVDVYDRKTTGALMAGVYPLETGASDYTQNFADVSNKGIEIDIFGDIVQTQDIIWSLGFNIAKNINTLDKFNKEGVSSYISRFYEVGKELNIITGYVVEGIFQTQKEIDDLNAKAPGTGAAKLYQAAGTAPGDYKYKDLDGDGKITTKDQEYLGSSQPDFFGGFNTQVSYKSISLSANFNYSVGGEATYAGDGSGLSAVGNNIETRYLDTWTPTNKDAKYPRAIISGGYSINNNLRRSSALVHDTSYLRLQSLQLEYHLPIDLVKNFGLSRLAFTVTGTNLWTLTNYPGTDPSALLGGFAERNSTNSRAPYPLAKTWSLGVNINF